MQSYYTDNCILLWVALAILCILVWENKWIRKEDKHIFYLTYFLIAAALFAEWISLQLGGRAGVPKAVLRVAKCLDYILSPMAGAALMAQMRLRNRYSIVMAVVLGFNTAFQVFSLFGGWMIEVDDQLHYTKGSLFVVYLLVCVLVAILVAIQWVHYSRSFRRRNRFSLYGILGLFLLSFIMQESSQRGSRTIYIGMTFVSAFLLIHFLEYRQQAADDFRESQEVQLNTDPLTGLLSRYAYSMELSRFETQGGVPEDLVAFLVDINDVKSVNDSLGHEMGDALIRGAAKCLEKALGGVGKCYRTGGDEFVIFSQMNPKEAEETFLAIEEEAGRWRGADGIRLHLAAGYALAREHPGISVEKLVSLADKAMYEAKRAYYARDGRDRRRSIQ